MERSEPLRTSQFRTFPAVNEWTIVHYLIALIVVLAALFVGLRAVYAFVNIPYITRQTAHYQATDRSADLPPYRWERRPLYGVLLALLAPALLFMAVLLWRA